jgi:hypothetical protein
MSTVYELIGRLWVSAVRRRYRRELKLATAAACVAAIAAVAAYAASRGDDED